MRDAPAEVVPSQRALAFAKWAVEQRVAQRGGPRREIKAGAVTRAGKRRNGGIVLVTPYTYPSAMWLYSAIIKKIAYMGFKCTRRASDVDAMVYMAAKAKVLPVASMSRNNKKESGVSVLHFVDKYDAHVARLVFDSELAKKQRRAVRRDKERVAATITPVVAQLEVARLQRENAQLRSRLASVNRTGGGAGGGAAAEDVVDLTVCGSDDDDVSEDAAAGAKKRPSGRAPKGKEWDYARGCWVDKDQGDAGLSTSTSTSSSTSANRNLNLREKKKRNKTKKRPSGRAPKGKEWDYARGCWVDKDSEDTGTSRKSPASAKAAKVAAAKNTRLWDEVAPGGEDADGKKKEFVKRPTGGKKRRRDEMQRRGGGGGGGGSSSSCSSGGGGGISGSRLAALVALRGEHVERLKKVKREKAAAESQAAALEDEVNCIVCAEQSRSVVFLPCNHFLCCTECAATIGSSAANVCPNCRHPIEKAVRVFR